MSATALLSGLRAAGVELALEGGQIILDGPAAALTNDVVAAVRDEKPAFRRLLAAEAFGWDAHDLAEFLAERVAVRVCDAGLSERTAERLAWRDVDVFLGLEERAQGPISLDMLRDVFDAEVVGAEPRVLTPQEEQAAIVAYAAQTRGAL